jgi:glucokinase
LILAGDVGATKTVLGLFRADDGSPALVSQQTFRSASYPGLAAMVQEFLPQRGHVKAACFGVAGAVIDGTAEVTNLFWSVKARALESDLRIERVSLINDLVATGYGITTLTEKDCLLLNRGTTVPFANAAVIAAGTGLGECTLHWDGHRYVPIPSEAGHADFAPYDETSVELTRYLRRQGMHASVEHILSGPGLLNIYKFVCSTADVRESPVIAEKIAVGDPAAAITLGALDENCELCRRALQIFVSAYGAEAGNLALRSVAVGGMYVEGGIARKIRQWLADGRFMGTFVDKDRQRELLSQIPVRVVLSDQTPLLGAVSYLMQDG